MSERPDGAPQRGREPSQSLSVDFPRGLEDPQDAVERGAAHYLPALEIKAIEGCEDNLAQYPSLLDAALSYWESEPHPPNRSYPATDADSVKRKQRQRAFAATVEQARLVVARRSAARYEWENLDPRATGDWTNITAVVRGFARAVTPGLACPFCGREYAFRTRSDLETRLLRDRKAGRETQCLRCTGEDDVELGMDIETLIEAHYTPLRGVSAQSPSGEQTTAESEAAQESSESTSGGDVYPRESPNGTGEEEVSFEALLGFDKQGGGEGDERPGSQRKARREARTRMHDYEDASIARDARETELWKDRTVRTLSLEEASFLYALLERNLPGGDERVCVAPATMDGSASGISETIPVGRGANELAAERSRGALVEDPFTPAGGMDCTVLDELLAEGILIPSPSTPDNLVSAPTSLFDGSGASEEGARPIETRHLPQAPLRLRRLRTSADSILDKEAPLSDIEEHLRGACGARLLAAREDLRSVFRTPSRPSRWQEDARAISKRIAYAECLSYLLYRTRIRNRRIEVTSNLKRALRSAVESFPVSRCHRLIYKSVEDATKRRRKGGKYFIDTDTGSGKAGAELGVSLQTIVDKTSGNAYWRERFDRKAQLPRSALSALFYEEVLYLGHAPALTPGYAAWDPGYYLHSDFSVDIDEDTGKPYEGEPENRSKGGG